MKIFPMMYFFLFCAVCGLYAQTVGGNASEPGVFLQVLAAESLQMGQILDREQRDFSFRVQNIQAIPLQLQQVRVSCPCLQILEAPRNLQLPPGGECFIRGRLDAGKLPVGQFSRFILMEFAGHGVQRVLVCGESVQMLEIEPGANLDLGTFAGVEVCWTRKVRIRSRFPVEKPFELTVPTADRYFEYELRRQDASEYELALSPKLPLPQGILRHSVQIPVRGVDHYGPIELRISGKVTGWPLTVKNRILVVDLKQTQADGRYSGEVKITVQDNRAGRRWRTVHDPQKEKSSNGFRPVAEDEKMAALLTRLETWQKISDEIEVVLPEKVSLEKIPQSDGVVMQFKFQPDFFTDDSSTSLLIHCRDRKLAVLRIVARE